MKTEQTTAKINVADVASQKDPALIPPEIYRAEGAMAQSHGNMFIGSDALDRMLPMDMRQQLVEKMDELARIVNDARAEITNQTGRRSVAVGKGFRNYGFMMASNQSMNNFPELAPNFINIDSFNDVVEDYLFAHDVSERMLAISNDVRDIMNIFGNIAFEFALAYYSNVRSIAERTRDQTAVSVFEILRRFFTRKRTPETGEDPTMKQLERHFHALMHGTRDGEIDVKNQNPTVSGRVHEAIDDTRTHRAQADFKAIEEGKIDE